MANLSSNNPDIISHQPTSITGHGIINNNNSNSNNNLNNINNNNYNIDNTTPWTYVPSGSIPLQRQDFHSSMKSLNLNGYSSAETRADEAPSSDRATSAEVDKRRVSSTPSQASVVSLPCPASTSIPAPGTSAFGSRDWSWDLFESFKECRKNRPLSSSLKHFFRDCFCVPCMMCDIAKSLGDKTCLPFIPGTGAAIRFKVRILGGIQGTIANDCLVTSCCCPCAVCQMYREIDDIGLAAR